jgi:hypothetical protein
MSEHGLSIALTLSDLHRVITSFFHIPAAAHYLAIRRALFLLASMPISCHNRSTAAGGSRV